MGENVQCPVCTLFLHAGMNLSDHLETHPKEQVIKALVQLTISGSAGAALAASLSGCGEPKKDPDEKKPNNKLGIPVETDVSNKAASENSSFVGSDSKHNNNNKSLNFAAAFSAIPAIAKSLAASTTTSIASSESTAPAISAVEKDDKSDTVKKFDVGNENDKVKVSHEMVAAPQNNSGQMSSGVRYENYASGYHHQVHQKQLPKGQLDSQHHQQKQLQLQHQHQQQKHQQQHQQQQEHQNPQQQSLQQSQQHQPQQQQPQQQRQQQATSQHQQGLQQQKQKQHHIDNANTSNAIGVPQRSSLPPPAPPIVAMPIVVGQMPSKLLHQAHSTNLFPSNLSTHRHVPMHAVQQQHQPLQHHQYQQQQQNNNQQTHQQQQQQQHQNLKIYYSTALPTPPPGLQLFPFHATAHMQHQKPPPAYGAAISQIRSQQSQSKNNHANGEKNHITLQQQLQNQMQRQQQQRQQQQQQQELQQQQSQQQQHRQLQQQQQIPLQRVTAQTPQQPQITVANVAAALQSRHHQQSLENIPTLGVAAKASTIETKSAELLPPPPPPARPLTNSHHHNHHHQMPHTMSHLGIPMLKSSTSVNQRAASTTNAGGSTIGAALLNHQPSPVATTASGNPVATISTPAIISIASAGGIRQVTSPYNSLLLSAAQSPSSSVLRYAESPVAHYLERDNGDFIVQETPKHIVECVEKDNGEFSVIERIYQSPLSVLHIHEDDDDEEDDDDDDVKEVDNDIDADDNNVKVNDENKAGSSHEQIPKDGDEPMDLEECTVNSKDLLLGKLNKSQGNANEKGERSSRSAHGKHTETNEKKTVVDNEKVQTKIYGNDRAATLNPNSNCNTKSDRSTPHSTGTSSSTGSSASTDNSSDTSSTSNSCSTSNTNNESNVLSSSSTASFNQSPNSHSSVVAGTSKKRNSKNTITVLSDVQLNLDEYLDLVGNIIASSKISAKSSMLSGSMPLPLLKVEKEEPPDDDYEMQNQPEEEQKYEEQQEEYFEEQNELKEFHHAPTVIEPPTIANINETEKLVENNCSYKVRINDSENDKNAIRSTETVAYDGRAGTTTTSSTCSSHVTSVIRMATTSQQQHQQQQIKLRKEIGHQPNDTAEKHSKNMNNDLAASTATTQSKVTSIIIQDLSRQHIIQLQDEEQQTQNVEELQSKSQKLVVSSQCERGLPIQLQQESPAKTEEQLQQHKTQQPQVITTLPVHKRGPKKLIIKPKVTKTDPNDNLNIHYNNNCKISNNINHNKNKNIDIKDKNDHLLINAEEEALDEQPTTSSKAQMELKEKTKQQQRKQKEELVGHELIKSEPTTSSFDSNTNRVCNSGFSILENHLNSSADGKVPIIQCKTEQSSSDPPSTNYLQPLKEEAREASNSIDDARVLNDDARVLLDFANSTKKHTSPHHTNVASFLSVSSIFSNATNAINHSKSPITTTATTPSISNTNTNSVDSEPGLRCDDEFMAHEDGQEIVISSSYSQSQSASDIPSNSNKSMNSTSKSKGKDLNAIQHQQQRDQHQQHQHNHQLQQNQPQQNQNLNHNFTDYPFSFLYGGAIGVHSAGGISGAQQLDNKNGNFSAIYQQATQDATTAATLASGSNTVHTDDSSQLSSTQQRHTQQHHNRQPHTNHFGSVHTTAGGGGGGEIGNNPSHWYQQANSDFEAALAVDCNAAIDGGDVGKYLDLDTCKREVLGGMSTVAAAPSSTSSSFAVATDSSLAGGSTADALNIRTDEKMPAKGEISGQESNCDIENSWSQPMYSEISARFFKTTFPGIFQHENGWNHDEYFTVQDLSASAAAASNAAASNRKSFDFRLPLEANSSAVANGIGNGNGNFQLFARHSDALPSTSTAIKKKRKRDSPGRNETGIGRIEKVTLSRMQPTATITSQQLLFHQQQQQQQHQQQQQQQQQQHQQQQQQQELQPHPQQLLSQEQLQQTQHIVNAATATTFISSDISSMENVDDGTDLLTPDPRRQRKKVYQCTHCTAEFPKLKERNSHMIMEHNYVRRNRRLICVQRPSISLAAPTSSSSRAHSNNPTSLNTNAGYNTTIVRSDSMEFLDDSKHGIVKIEVDNAYQQIEAGPSATSTLSKPDDVIVAKPEYTEDNKQNMTSAAENGEGNANASNEDENVDATTTNAVVDPKLALRPLAMTTPSTKLAALYRMLVSYNISTLKDSHNLSEMEQKLIEQSIFFCYVCRRNFTSVKLYDAHLTEHPAECFTCGKSFQRWKNFSLHLKRHLGWKEFGCNVCDKKFVVRSALVEHMRMHTGHTPLKCKVCGKYFKRYSNLTQHRKRHGKQIIRKKEYVCHCGEVLPSKARFLWHKETHDAKPKCCPYCCDRFVHANSLRRHIRLAHSDKFDYTEPMECPLCKQTFAKSSMKAHMATHSMDTQHDCAICNKSFSTKWNLKIHSWVHANRTAKPFKCEHCPKAFVREVDFKNHMNAHKQIKPYTCEYCGCKFIRKYNYMRHRREHHGNKKFTCDLCKKSFHRHYYLIEHRRIHTGERPFQCTICGKSSTTKTNHNKHLKIHHSRDPFTVEA